MDPQQFLVQSTLKKSELLGNDKIYDESKKKWVSHTHKNLNQKISNKSLNLFKLKNSKNYRPHDQNSGDITVYLETKDNLIGERNPTNLVPSFFFPLSDGRKQYWLFYGYNYSKVLGLNLSHQGDWESITLKVINKQIEGAWLSAHGKDNFYNKNELKIVNTGDIQTLFVYSAKGTHALYNKPGSFHILNSDKAANKGVQWVITDLEQNLTTQYWKDYSGAWGKKGFIRTTTGPLGPMFKILKVK